MKIINTNIKHDGEMYDYKLENGELLHTKEWNGEVYTVHNGGRETTYKPIHRFENEGIDISTLEENSDEWNKACEIVEFKEY